MIYINDESKESYFFLYPVVLWNFAYACCKSHQFFCILYFFLIWLAVYKHKHDKQEIFCIKSSSSHLTACLSTKHDVQKVSFFFYYNWKLYVMHLIVVWYCHFQLVLVNLLSDFTSCKITQIFVRSSYIKMSVTNALMNLEKTIDYITIKITCIYIIYYR